MASNPVIAKPNPTVPALALRPREAAAAIGICPRTLWTMTQRGDVPHVRIGRAVVYPVRELQDWLTAQAREGVGDE